MHGLTKMEIKEIISKMDEISKQIVELRTQFNSLEDKLIKKIQEAKK